MGISFGIVFGVEAALITAASIAGLIVMLLHPDASATVVGLVACAAALTTAAYGLFMAREHRLLRIARRTTAARPTGDEPGRE